jgi:NAD(P)-dependent dehydrogenase (short-subunit alcohol dehydrogenase family)
MSYDQDRMAADQAVDLPIVATAENCKGATFIVTGANIGLGYEAAKHFVRLQSAKVILAVRTPAKGEEAKAKIEAETGVTGVAEVWPLDMSSYHSIKAFAEKVKALSRVDAIVENAAQALMTFTLSDGLETSLVVNVTGTMLLAALVIPKLQESAKKFGIIPHISMIGSGAAFSVPGALEAIPSDADILDYYSTESNGMKDR